MRKIGLVAICGVFLLASCGQKQALQAEPQAAEVPASAQTAVEETAEKQPDSDESAEKKDAKPAEKAEQKMDETAAAGEKKDTATEEVMGNLPAEDAVISAIPSYLESRDYSVSSIDEALGKAQKYEAAKRFDDALRILYEAETHFGISAKLDTEYQRILGVHPLLHAEPRKLVPGKDIATMKRIGGGSSLVYKFIKDKETIAAFKPFQKRYQSNYRSEIAAYRLCPAMKCGFDVPVNVPVWFDFDAFSSMYSHNSANPREEFAEIIPTKLDPGTVRVDGTYKDWIREFAEYPIEFSAIWKRWLNLGMQRDELDVEASTLLPVFESKHKRGKRFADKLAPHLEGVTVYQIARQLSNLLVFDYLINNWDRFSGSPDLYGVNCQISHGRFMSIDNGAGFSQTPNPKPDKHLHEISRFSRMTYEAIKAFDKDKMRDYLFPNATGHEQEKFETFWSQREKYLKYVDDCVKANGEHETFFFE